MSETNHQYSENYDKLINLREEVYNCKACPLATTRTKVVFGNGNPDADLMIIGEGPGANEDTTGIPFVGRAGKLLTECLEECNISRKHVFIANVVKCRACIINKTTNKNRPPTDEEINLCTPWLEKQIEIIKPLVVLSLGAPSARFMLNRKDIAMTKERGIFYKSRFSDNVIPSLHPSYILRNMYKDGDGGKSLLIKDIKSAISKVSELKGQVTENSVIITPNEVQMNIQTESKIDENKTDTNLKNDPTFGF